MTPVSRYGHMLKVTGKSLPIRVTARYRVDGAVLDDTIQARMLGAETTLEIEFPDPPGGAGGGREPALGRGSQSAARRTAHGPRSCAGEGG